MGSAAGQDARIEAMLRGLKRSGMKLTPQRRAIVQLFAGCTTHPTAQELYESVRASRPRRGVAISFATVYNTLDALAAAGLSRVLRLGPAARFDPFVEPHHHAVCDACGAVVDVPAGRRASGRAVARAAPGFVVRTVERIYRGHCAACARDA